MKIFCYSGEEGCGKTKKARELFSQDPENTLLIEALPYSDFELIKRKLVGGSKRRVIIDEYRFLLLTVSEVELFSFMRNFYRCEELVLTMTGDTKELIKKEITE